MTFQCLVLVLKNLIKVRKNTLCNTTCNVNIAGSITFKSFLFYISFKIGDWLDEEH